MIGKVIRGKSVGGLLRYLYGPGKANAHVDPHLVAAWDEPNALEPALTVADRRDFRPLIEKLNTPLAGARAPKECVWHVPLRSAPGDRTLSDPEWADVVAEVLDRTGLAPRGDDGGCRWVAVRHADDHVHLVVTLARQDGRRAALHNDYYRVGEACQAIEERYGLAITPGRDRSAAARSSRAETEKASRLDKPAPARDLLRTEVQTAAAASRSDGEFFARLEGAGVKVRRRYSEIQPDQVTGYAVALPVELGGTSTAAGEPIWFGGAKLAPDLSLPKLRAHWGADGTGATTTAASTGPDNGSGRLRLRHEVERAAQGAAGPEEFFARLREGGVLVRERYSEIHPDEVTGYAVALPGERDLQGQPVWRGGGSLAPELSLPRLQAQWGGHEEGPPKRPAGRTRRLTAEERGQVWSEARQTADEATERIRQSAGRDPAAAAGAARAAADVLNVAARTHEPGGKGPLTDAARAYDRASRDLHGRQAPRGPVGNDLRMTAMTLGLLVSAGRNESAAMIGLVLALAGLVEAMAELRATEARVAEAAAARQAGTQLHEAATTMAAGTTTGTRPRPAAPPVPSTTYRPPSPGGPERGR